MAVMSELKLRPPKFRKAHTLLQGLKPILSAPYVGAKSSHLLKRSERRPPPFGTPLEARGKQGKQSAAATRPERSLHLLAGLKPSLYISGELQICRELRWDGASELGPNRGWRRLGLAQSSIC